MAIEENNFLQRVKNIVTGQNAAVNNTGTIQASDGGFKIDYPIQLTDITNTGAAPGSTFATSTIIVPVTLANIANAQTLNVDPGFNGKINSVTFRVGDKAVTTGSKLATLAAQIAGTAVTGGTLALTSANSTPSGAAVAASAVTGLNTFTSAQAIGVVASSVTAFTEGNGYVELNVTNTDLQTAINTIQGDEAASETNSFVLKVPAGTTTVGKLLLSIPREYDEASDHLYLRLFVNQLTRATDTAVGLQAVAYVKVLGTALSASKGTVPGIAPFSLATTDLVLSTTEQVVEFNFSGYGLKRDTVITVVLSTNGGNATAGEEVQIFGGGWSWESCLVSYNDTDTTGVDGALAQYGNPLR